MNGSALGTFVPGSREWHDARATRVGGSDIGTIVGWSPYETRQQLLDRKLGILPPKEHTAAMDRGDHLESGIIAHTLKKLGEQEDQVASAATYVHTDRDWQLANPDAITTQGTLIEAKTTADRHVETDEDERMRQAARSMLWGRAGTDRVPLTYLAQVQWTLGVTGLDHAVLTVLHGATNGRPDLAFSIYRISFNPRLFDWLTRQGEAFYHQLTSMKEQA